MNNSRSQLLVDIELNVSSFKRKCRKIMCDYTRKLCPKSLRNFDKKYPQMAGFKKDIGRLAYLVVVKTVFVIIVLPVVTLFTLVESIKYLFKKKEVKS